MMNNGIIRNLIDTIKDPEREITERIYLVLSIVSEIMVFIALIGDFIIQENPYEIAAIIGTLIFVPSIMFISLRINKIMAAIKITVVGLVFIILPSLYIFGGGVQGGGFLWIIFTFTYAGLVLKGTWRKTMLFLIILESVCCYLIEYYYPGLMYQHSRGHFLFDSFMSVILVGFICFIMTLLQNIFFRDENARARAAADKAEELTKSQNRFFSSMSHEIRTPINSILGLNELILRDDTASDEIIMDSVGIQGSGKMLLALINDILDFSKMEAGSMAIVPVDYRIGDMLSEIVNMVWLKAHEKGIKLSVSIDPKVPSVLYGDEVRLKQIIINLLNNAVKYTGAGSIDLHIESELKDEKNVELSISISDTGMGIKKEVIPFLFDAFKRVDEEKNRYIEGTGLGLSIVKQLVELMGGTITVNSVYGEGSTFTVVLNQGISDSSEIGELNIHNQSTVKRDAYEASFRAPEARILIVDDNVMNLEVEAKLLSDTDIKIDMATSGNEALELDLKYRYDVIFMDHLMPEMDGIECLVKIRNHDGGMNRTTPIIVLTANAGSDNRELYNRSGFEGYLVKPVSGEALESTLIKYIPEEKLILNTNKVMTLREDINAVAGYTGKAPVIITSSSMCDLPNSIIKKLRIPIIPFRIRTDEGVFKDGIQMGADELIRYLSRGKNATSAPPDEQTYTDFFAEGLKKAHHLIHISLTTSMSDEYTIASEAAKSFDNVTVINSGCISSSVGLLVLIAYKLSQINDNVDEIVDELEMVKQRLKCSFVIKTTEFMARKGLISAGIDHIARSLNLHPCLTISHDKSRISGIWVGNTRRAYKRYISAAIPVDIIPDPELIFITYADIPKETLMWIKEEISRHAYFENVVFKQASAAISSNCGPGSFGILYFVKSNKSYNLSSIFENETLTMENDTEAGRTEDDDEYEDEADAVDISELLSDTRAILEPAPPKWYDSIPGINGKAAITNSGSETAFKSVLKIFYESIETYAGELQGFYDNSDWPSYTIKIHALKSSCRLIGALDTAKKAEDLEMAGKAENIDFIKENHDGFLVDYMSYKEPLGTIFGEDEENKESSEKPKDKPVISSVLLDSVYEGLKDAAESMDYDAIEEMMEEVKRYEIPEDDLKKLQALNEKAGQFDYDGMLEILNNSPD
ncbi:DegV family protein [Butyrivibrio sp. VCD2006]|uniref:DegV family protein n=1 Tax=Butyrivibrio sp. VCD2006 TaxID=1280664 RepID=UPI0003FD55C6|nr:DegV family protein [Butyrivibrio sp. VCD2006]